MYNLQAFEKLFEEFNAIYKENLQKEQTFMQLSGYPHYENVCSNLLCFFFDTEEAHGFEDLFIRSLLECAFIDEHMKRYHTEMVERECITRKNNRIDIVVETENQIIGIENKIYSDVHNDLCDYASYVKKRGTDSNGKEPICVLLSINNNDKNVNKTEFCSIAYSKFIERIKINIGSYLGKANTKWIVFVNDFLISLEDLQGGTKLDKELVEFFNKNLNSIKKLFEARTNLSKSLKEKVNKIKDIVSVNEELPVKHLTYCPKNEYFAEYYIEYDGSTQIDGQIVFSAYIDLKACYIIVGVREDTDIQKKRLTKYLEESKVNTRKWLDNDVYLQLEELSVFESETVIAEKFQELLNIVLKL